MRKQRIKMFRNMKVLSRYILNQAEYILLFSTHMTGADYLNIKPGAKNGQRNGLSLLVDVDSFEYGDYPKVDI